MYLARDNILRSLYLCVFVRYETAIRLLSIVIKPKLCSGSRHYIHADDVASAVLFLLNYEGKFDPTWGNAKCPKFNIVGAEELDNLKLAEIIAKAQDKKLNYELVDFHSSRNEELITQMTYVMHLMVTR